MVKGNCVKTRKSLETFYPWLLRYRFLLIQKVNEKADIETVHAIEVNYLIITRFVARNCQKSMLNFFGKRDKMILQRLIR